MPQREINAGGRNPATINGRLPNGEDWDGPPTARQYETLKQMGRGFPEQATLGKCAEAINRAYGDRRRREARS